MPCHRGVFIFRQKSDFLRAEWNEIKQIDSLPLRQHWMVRVLSAVSESSRVVDKAGDSVSERTVPSVIKAQAISCFFVDECSSQE